MDLAAGNLTARLPDCRFAGKREALKLLNIVLLSVYLLFLSGCTTRKNLRQNLFLSWPLKATPKISQNFSLRSPHDGIDIVAPMNLEIFSAHEGYVIYAGNGYRGYGNLIILDSGQGWSSFYAHLSRVFVKEGFFVQRGDVIGTIGMTGKSIRSSSTL